jgi:mycobactin peptide synthetase MbtE
VSDTEVRLIALLASVLDRSSEGIGTEDNFFDLGANSLALIKMTSLISSEFNKQLKVVTLFDYPNIRSLVKYYFDKEEYPAGRIDAGMDAEKKLDEALSLFSEQ